MTAHGSKRLTELPSESACSCGFKIYTYDFHRPEWWHLNVPLWLSASKDTSHKNTPLWLFSFHIVKGFSLIALGFCVRSVSRAPKYHLRVLSSRTILGTQNNTPGDCSQNTEVSSLVRCVLFGFCVFVQEIAVIVCSFIESVSVEKSNINIDKLSIVRNFLNHPSISKGGAPYVTLSRYHKNMCDAP